MADHRLLHSDYPAAISGETTPRTLSAHDIGTFAALTGDYSRIHLDDAFGARLPYGGRIAHGLLSASWALGALSLDAGLTDFQVLSQTSECVTEGHLLLHLPMDAAARSQLPPRPAAWPESTFELEPGRSYYLEDLYPGSLAGQTEGRTLTETDAVGYGHFTGDYGVHYGNAEIAARGLFGARIVQPMLVFDVGFALWLRDWSRMGSPEGSGTAGHLCDRWTFHAPFYFGDTLQCRFRILASRASKTRPGTGLVTCGLQMINQREEVAMSSEVVLMYPAGPAASA